MIEKLLTTENITSIISVTIFAGLCYILFVGYFVSIPPSWWISH